MIFTNKHFIAYLKTLVVEDKDVKFYNSFTDYSSEKSISVYNSSNQAAMRADGLAVLPVTILICYGTNADKCQEFAMDLFFKLFKQGKKTYNGTEFTVDITTMPVSLGKSEAGYFSFAIDCKIYYNKED